MKFIVATLLVFGITSSGIASDNPLAQRLERLEKIINIQGLDKAVKCQLKGLSNFGFPSDEKIVAVGKDRSEAARKLKAECNERAPDKHYCQLVGESANLMACEDVSIDEVLN